MLPLAKTAKCAVCYGDHLWRTEEETHNSAELPEEKVQGISFMMDLSVVGKRGRGFESHPNTNWEHKGSKPGVWGWAVHWVHVRYPVKEHCLIWTIVSRGPSTLLDKCLCQSSIQSPLHSLHSSCSQTQKRSKYVSDDSSTPLQTLMN